MSRFSNTTTVASLISLNETILLEEHLTSYINFVNFIIFEKIPLKTATHRKYSGKLSHY